MRRSEEINLRSGLVYDPLVRGADTDFWNGDTAVPTFDTGDNSVKIGDTGLVGSVSSFSQFLMGDFEFAITTDSLSPDSNDGVTATVGKRWGLVNAGDTLTRGAAYFEMRFDSVTGGDTTNTRPFRAVIVDENGNVQRKKITWDSAWENRNTRYRINWNEDGYTFAVNDTIYATLGDKPDSSNATFQINTTIPQALRLDNRSLDVADTGCMRLRFLTVRNSRMINNVNIRA